MKTTFHCIPCHVNHIYRVISGLPFDDTLKLTILQEVLPYIIRNYQAPPDCAYEMYRIVRERTGIKDPFDKIKKQSNERMMALVPDLRKLLSAGGTLQKALQIALVANIIDYGIGGNAYYDDYADTFRNLVEDCMIPDEFYTHFVQSVNSSQKILYIADNAGEIVADKLLVECLPKDKVIFAVRGGPVINDATIEDAHSIGLDTVVPVITTGDQTPGINLARCSKDFLYELSQADMVILKGQGNFEAMIDASLEGIAKKGLKMFFLFKVKCLPVADFTHKKIGDSAFMLREL